MSSLEHLVFKLLLTCFFFAFATASDPPNIVFILADDLGWNDIGYNNPDIISPNLDALANSGIILDQSYVQPLCSPSRSALMTGVYPFRMGLQGQPVCAPLERKFLSEVLRDEGYATHLVGKWHLGFCKPECTPPYRGFDSFYGFYLAAEDYYTKMRSNYFDFHDNETVDRTANETYSTELYTERFKEIISDHNETQPLFLYLSYQSVHTPLQVPQKYYDMYPDVSSEDRRTFSGMVTAMDDSIGELVQALTDKGIYNNTLFVFSSDNGGLVVGGGNNFPLRGGKATIFEGGTRVPAFVSGPMFTTTGVRYDGLLHMVDWFPTLVEAVGSSYTDSDQDGVSQWQSLLSLTTPSSRNEIIYNMDLSSNPIQGRSAIRVGDYKLIDGFPGLFQGWYRPGGGLIRERITDIFTTNTSRMIQFNVAVPLIPNLNPFRFQRLFNLKDDPNERRNIYLRRPDIVRQLRSRLRDHRAKYVPPNFPVTDPSSDPSNFGGAWTTGWCLTTS